MWGDRIADTRGYAKPLIFSDPLASPERIDPLLGISVRHGSPRGSSEIIGISLQPIGPYADKLVSGGQPPRLTTYPALPLPPILGAWGIRGTYYLRGKDNGRQ